MPNTMRTDLLDFDKAFVSEKADITDKRSLLNNLNEAMAKEDIKSIKQEIKKIISSVKKVTRIQDDVVGDDSSNVGMNSDSLIENLKQALNAYFSSPLFCCTCGKVYNKSL